MTINNNNKQDATHAPQYVKCNGQVCTSFNNTVLSYFKLLRNTTSKLRHTGGQRSRPKITLKQKILQIHKIQGNLLNRI